MTWKGLVGKPALHWRSPSQKVSHKRNRRRSYSAWADKCPNEGDGQFWRTFYFLSKKLLRIVSRIVERQGVGTTICRNVVYVIVHEDFSVIRVTPPYNGAAYSFVNSIERHLSVQTLRGKRLSLVVASGGDRVESGEPDRYNGLGRGVDIKGACRSLAQTHLRRLNPRRVRNILA